MYLTIVDALSCGNSFSKETKNESIPCVMSSIFLSNKASLLDATVSTLSLIEGLFDVITVAAVAEGAEVFGLLVTSSFISSFQLYKMVFNT